MSTAGDTFRALATAEQLREELNYKVRCKALEQLCRDMYEAAIEYRTCSAPDEYRTDECVNPFQKCPKCKWYTHLRRHIPGRRDFGRLAPHYTIVYKSWR